MLTRIGWTALVIFCFVFGAIGLAVLPVGATAGWTMLAIAVGLSVSQCADEIRKLRLLNGRTGSAAGLGLAAAAGVITACLVIGGLVAVFGAATAMAVVVGIGIALAPRRLRSRRPATPPEEAMATVMPDAPGPAAAELPTGELCLAWRRSYLALHRTTDETARRQLVQRRQEYLDELERRDREGFTRWLGSGARAGSDPERYLTAGG